MMGITPSMRKGAALLDERVPGWADRIDVNHLSFLSPSRCVLGQLYGYVERGLVQLGLPALDDSHGFACDAAGDVTACHCEDLTEPPGGHVVRDIVADVKAGAELLDSEVRGWAARIDAAALDFMSPTRCVLGQLFGTYLDGFEALDPHGHINPPDIGVNCHPWAEENVTCYCPRPAGPWRDAVRQRMEATS